MLYECMLPNYYHLFFLVLLSISARYFNSVIDFFLSNVFFCVHTLKSEKLKAKSKKIKQMALLQNTELTSLKNFIVPAMCVAFSLELKATYCRIYKILYFRSLFQVKNLWSLHDEKHRKKYPTCCFFFITFFARFYFCIEFCI